MQKNKIADKTANLIFLAPLLKLNILYNCSFDYTLLYFYCQQKTVCKYSFFIKKTNIFIFVNFMVVKIFNNFYNILNYHLL